MTFKKVVFPLFPEFEVFISLYQNVQSEKLLEVKKRLTSGESEYDYAFLNTTNLISIEQIQYAIHRSLLNQSNKAMKAKSLNAEIIYNLSPVNNIMEAFKRFGIDEKNPNVVVVKVYKVEDGVDMEKVSQSLGTLLESESTELSDDVLLRVVDINKLKKTYKIGSVDVGSDLQGGLTRLVIGSCIIRGV